MFCWQTTCWHISYAMLHFISIYLHFTVYHSQDNRAIICVFTIPSSEQITNTKKYNEEFVNKSIRKHELTLLVRIRCTRLSTQWVPNTIAKLHLQLRPLHPRAFTMDDSTAVPCPGSRDPGYAVVSPVQLLTPQVRTGVSAERREGPRAIVKSLGAWGGMAVASEWL